MAAAPMFLGLTYRELWWPIAAAVLLLLINKLVVHDGGSFFGGVLATGFWIGVGVGVVNLVKWLVRQATTA